VLAEEERAKRKAKDGREEVERAYAARLSTRHEAEPEELALSLLLVPLFGSALNSVPRSKATGAAGLMNLMFQLGGSFGTAILTTMLERDTNLFHALWWSTPGPITMRGLRRWARSQRS
jgi:hypothetical protein